MSTLTKFDVLFYLSQMGKPRKKELVALIKRNILFINVSGRSVSDKLRALKKEKFVKDMNVDLENKRTIDCLAFLYWSKMKGVDYNKLLDKKVTSIFRALFENGLLELKDLLKTGLSKPTILKYVNMLSESKVITIVKRKPMMLKSNLNDLTFFYANFLDLSFEKFEKQFNIPHFPKMQSKKLIEMLIRLHVYSTTVTEGNTATEKDVERIFSDYPVNLTPREVTEILNARSAIHELFSISKNNMNLNHIKHLHKILMSNLIEKPGDFYYGAKRIAGFETKLPSSKQEIDFSMETLLNFCEKKINPLVLGSLIHFVFASIHPFADGNGRIARLLHSWILLKHGMPLFVFDPNKRNEYFALLEKTRNESIEDFINFCIGEHSISLKKITKGREKI